MENLDQPNQTEKPQKKLSFKTKALIALLFVILLVAVAVFYWFRSTQNLRNEAQTVLSDVGRFEALKTKVEAERSRCENFISQKQGDFGSFEYCQKFIDWASGVAE